MTGFEIGEFEEDGALDQRDALIKWLEHRIESALRTDDFSSVEVSEVRANISML